MKIQSFNEHLNNDYSFYGKEQLDAMTKEEIKEYRYKIIQDNAGWSDDKNIIEIKNAQADWKQYLEELEAYKEIRFKQDTFDMYDRWIKLAAEGDETYKVMSRMVETELGKEQIYNMGLCTQLETVGEFKYIIGIEINVDQDMTNLVKLLSKK